MKASTVNHSTLSIPASADRPWGHGLPARVRRATGWQPVLPGAYARCAHVEENFGTIDDVRSIPLYRKAAEAFTMTLTSGSDNLQLTQSPKMVYY